MVVELTFMCLVGACAVPKQEGQLFAHEEDCKIIADYLSNDQLKGNCIDPDSVRIFTAEKECKLPNGRVALAVKHLSGIVDCNNTR